MTKIYSCSCPLEEDTYVHDQLELNATLFNEEGEVFRIDEDLIKTEEEWIIENDGHFADFETTVS